MDAVNGTTAPPVLQRTEIFSLTRVWFNYQKFCTLLNQHERLHSRLRRHAEEEFCIRGAVFIYYRRHSVLHTSIQKNAQNSYKIQNEIFLGTQ